MAVIVTGTSESGDYYFYGVFDRPLTTHEFVTLVKQKTPDEVTDEECYVWPRYQNWDGFIASVPKADSDLAEVELI